MKNNKLAQREVYVNGGYSVTVSLVNDVGYISIRDGNLYPEGDSRYDRRELGFETMMIPLMTREDIKSVKKILKEVLKNSK